MGTARKYVVIDPATGKLDRRIFSEQAIYDDEMEKIFGRAWLMIGHESRVPAVDDFFHTYTGAPAGVPLCPQTRQLAQHGRDRDRRAARSVPRPAHRRAPAARRRNR